MKRLLLAASLLYFTGQIAKATSPKCPDNQSYFNGKCYWLGEGFPTFVDAEFSCQSGGGHLASIRNAFENAFVVTLLNPDRSAWIGAYYHSMQGEWLWTDNSSFVYNTHWTPGQPIYSYMYMCGITSKIDFGLWMAAPCHWFGGLNFVCAAPVADAAKNLKNQKSEQHLVAETAPSCQYTAEVDIAVVWQVPTVPSNNAFSYPHWQINAEFTNAFLLSSDIWQPYRMGERVAQRATIPYPNPEFHDTAGVISSYAELLSGFYDFYGLVYPQGKLAQANLFSTLNDSRIVEGLRYLRDVFNTADNHRRNVTNLIFVIANSDVGVDAEAVAVADSLKSSGAIIIAIALNSTGTAEKVGALASDPEVFFATDKIADPFIADAIGKATGAYLISVGGTCDRK